MNISHANLLAITLAVREARLDWQACESARVERGYQWRPIADELGEGAAAIDDATAGVDGCFGPAPHPSLA